MVVVELNETIKCVHMFVHLSKSSNILQGAKEKRWLDEKGEGKGGAQPEKNKGIKWWNKKKITYKKIWWNKM